MKLQHYLPILVLTCFYASSCAKNTDEKGKASKSYSFTADANAELSIADSDKSLDFGDDFAKDPREQKSTTEGPVLCSSVVCFTATALTGKYYGIGLSIQSAGNGMVAYFGQDTWSTITGTSTSYDFDASSPIINAGTLTCCNGVGDLSSSNTYVESVMYLFSYLDATFTVANVTGNTTMNQSFTLRFVFADEAIPSGVRGDILIKDLNLPNGQGGVNDGEFKWVSSGSGALTTTRPSDPVAMNESITNYTNPFGPNAGNQSIPVIYAGVLPANSSESGLFTITEENLKTAGNTYSFAFNPTNFIMFPTLISSGGDINMISSVKSMMQKVHLGGLPHSMQSYGVGNPASTVLTVL